MNWFDKILRRLACSLAELSPSCKVAARLQSEALDHKLTRRQQLGLRIHLVLCKWCSRYGKQIAFVREAAQSQPDKATTAIPRHLTDEAKQRIRKRLNSEINGS